MLPTSPRNINVAYVAQSAIELRWLPPIITGDRTRVYYDVDCRMSCDSDDENAECVDKECGSDVTYLPYKEGLKLTQVMVTNLSSFVNYGFKIYANNRVSEVVKRRHGFEGNFITIIVRTNGSSELQSFCNVHQESDILVIVKRLPPPKAFYFFLIAKSDLETGSEQESASGSW